MRTRLLSKMLNRCWRLSKTHFLAQNPCIRLCWVVPASFSHCDIQVLSLYIRLGICSDFTNTTAHFLYPVLALVVFPFSPDWSWKGLGSSLKFPVLQPSQDVQGMEAEAPTQSQKPWGEDTMSCPHTSSCFAAQWEPDTPAICFSAMAQVFWSLQNIGHSKNLEIRKLLETHIQRFPVYRLMSHN